MASTPIRIKDLPSDATPNVADVLPVDNGATRKTTLADLVNAVAPVASTEEAEAGVDNTKRMTAARVKEAIAAQIGDVTGTMAQEDAADYTPTSGLGAAALSNSYDDLDDKPSLGTAAVENVEAFATAAQGATADTAMQPGAFGLGGVTSVPDDGDDEAVISFIRFGVSTPNGPGFGAIAINMVDAGGRRFQIAYEIGFTANPRIAARERNTSGSWTAWRSDISGADKATVAYVDEQVSGVGQQIAPVRAATTGNITLSGAQTIDGVSVVAGNHVLVKNQSTGSQNGVYTAAAGSWTRRADSDTWDEVRGKRVFVLEGTTQAGSGWSNTNVAGGTLGTTAVTYQQSSSGQIYTGGTGVTVAGTTIQIDSGTLSDIDGAAQKSADLSDLADQTVAQKNLGVIKPAVRYGATGAGGSTDINAVTAMLAAAKSELPAPQVGVQGSLKMSNIITRATHLEPFMPYFNALVMDTEYEIAKYGKAIVFDGPNPYWAGNARSASIAQGDSTGYLILPQIGTVVWEQPCLFNDWPLASSPNIFHRTATMGAAVAVNHHIGAGVTRTFTTASAHGFARGDRIRIIATTGHTNSSGSWTHGKEETGWSAARSEDHIVHSVQSSTQFTTFNYAEDNYQLSQSTPVVQKYVDEPRLRLINPWLVGPGRPVGNSGGGDRAINVVGGRDLRIEGGRIEDFGGAFLRLGSIMGGSVRDLYCRGTLDSVDLGQAIGRGIFYGGGMSDFLFDNVIVEGGGQSFMHSGLGGASEAAAGLGISRRITHRDCTVYGSGLGAFTQHMVGDQIEYYGCKVIGGPNCQWGFDIRTPNNLIKDCYVTDLPAGGAVAFRHNINGLNIDGLRVTNVNGGIRLTAFNGNDSWVTPPGDITIQNCTISAGGPTSAGGINITYGVQDGGSLADLGKLILKNNRVSVSGNTVAVRIGGKWQRPIVDGLSVEGSGTGRCLYMYGADNGAGNGPFAPVYGNVTYNSTQPGPQVQDSTGTTRSYNNYQLS